MGTQIKRGKRSWTEGEESRHGAELGRKHAFSEKKRKVYQILQGNSESIITFQNNRTKEEVPLGWGKSDKRDQKKKDQNN